MAIEHIVLIEPNEGVTDADAQPALDGIAALKGQIPGLLSVKIGKNFTDRAPHVGYAAVITLENKEALSNYGPHPAHQELLKILLPIAKSLTIADIEV